LPPLLDAPADGSGSREALVVQARPESQYRLTALAQYFGKTPEA
jgi:hypothetical protein